MTDEQEIEAEMEPRRDLAAEKLAAEIDKLTAEAEATRDKAAAETLKMKAEAHELRRPFWHRPGFYAALLPALATAATIGWCSGIGQRFLIGESGEAFVGQPEGGPSGHWYRAEALVEGD